MKTLSSPLAFITIGILLTSLPSCNLYMQQKINELPHELMPSSGEIQAMLDGIKSSNKAMASIHDKASADAAAPAIKAAFEHMNARPEEDTNPNESNWKRMKKIKRLATELHDKYAETWSDNLYRLRDNRYYGSQSLKKAIPLDRITFLSKNPTNSKNSLKE